ncbi:MAG: hypothetical protein ACQESA_02815 [Patescibacteria group bacterium]
MFSLIERLQKKPKYKRKLIALSFSGGVTFLIFLFWASGMYLYGGYSSENNASEREISPFRVINRHVDDFVGAVGETFSDIDRVLNKNGVYDLYEDPEKPIEKKNSKNIDKEKSEGYNMKEERSFGTEKEERNTEEWADDPEADEGVKKGDGEFEEEEF